MPRQRAAGPSIETLLEHLPGAWFLVRRDDSLAYVNSDAAALLLTTQSDLLQHDFNQFTFEEGVDRALPLFERLGNAGKLTFPAYQRRRDALNVPVTLLASRFDFEEEPLVVVQAIDRSMEVAHERALEKSVDLLRHSQKMEAVGQLAGGIAHDFNNLLQIMRGNLELLAHQSLGEYPQQLTDDIAHATDRAAKLVRQLLTFSRKDPVQFAPLRLDGVIVALLGMLRRLLGEDIEVEWSTDSSHPFIRANAPQLEQILVNLCVNARDAMPRGGHLRISVTRESFVPPSTAQKPNQTPIACAVLTVQDDGEGMRAEIRERVFEPFFTTKDVGRGTGLGLATVYAITERHGGFIQVDSDVGRGTSFRLYFPIVDGPQTPPSRTKTHRTIEGDNRLVLVAEDDPQVRSLTARFLTRSGFRVVTAVDGEEAQALILQHEAELSLVVLDAVMPRLRGPDVIRTMRARGCKAPCLMVTGYDFHSLELVPGLEHVQVLQKPFNGPQLVDCLAGLLEKDLGNRC